MQVENQVTQPDASAWTAVVVVAGAKFVASYVAGKVTAKLAPYKHQPRRPRWAIGHVQKWAEAEVAKLPAEWHQAHKALYQI